MKEQKYWTAGRARQEELDEIDRCNLCRFLPRLAETCYATKYCHRQMRMEIVDEGNDDGRRSEEHAERQ